MEEIGESSILDGIRRLYVFVEYSTSELLAQGFFTILTYASQRQLVYNRK